MKKINILTVVILSVLFFVTGCGNDVNTMGAVQEAINMQVNSQIEVLKRPYSEIVASESQPGIAPDYLFPKGYQYENGCFGFAIQYIVEHKFGETIDMVKAEKIIKKPRYELWTFNYIKDFLEEYGLDLKWYNDSETFFEFLEAGEPLLIQYKYPVGENRWISHFVAVYSFDEDGVWISQSITNKYEKIPYRHVFKPDGITTQFSFAVVENFNPKMSEIETAATPDIN